MKKHDVDKTIWNQLQNYTKLLIRYNSIKLNDYQSLVK